MPLQILTILKTGLQMSSQTNQTEEELVDLITDAMVDKTTHAVHIQADTPLGKSHTWFDRDTIAFINVEQAGMIERPKQIDVSGKVTPNPNLKLQ